MKSRQHVGFQRVRSGERRLHDPGFRQDSGFRDSGFGQDSGGFTILEIMIATAILTLGLVSVLALFPAAIRTGKTVIDNSNAVVIAESVAEAIREGMRNHIRVIDRPDGADRYFVLKHDGVVDPVPNQRSQERPEKDYYILLPRFPDGPRGTFSGGSSEDRRANAVRAGAVFVYPETDPLRNGGGFAERADNDGLDFRGRLSNDKAFTDFVVENVYQLGRLLPTDDASGVSVLGDQQIEVLKQYSFAFAVRVSKYDANRSQLDARFQPANRLYHFEVMVFRSFIKPARGKLHAPPVFTLDFEVAL